MPPDNLKSRFFKNLDNSKFCSGPLHFELTEFYCNSKKELYFYKSVLRYSLRVTCMSVQKSVVSIENNRVEHNLSYKYSTCIVQVLIYYTDSIRLSWISYHIPTRPISSILGTTFTKFH